MKFDDYRISGGLKSSLEKIGFKRPTDIQFKAIGPIMKGEDVLAIAQTGTGKTAAFVIPVLDLLQKRINRDRSEGVKCIVMAPTRELAIQIHGVFQQIGKNLRIKTLALTGGVEQDPQIAALKKGVDVLVATPGRLFDLVSQGHLKLDKIQILVLDEADHMLDLGFYPDIEALLKFIPKRRQTLFFSATINKSIKKLAYSLVSKPIRIQISPKDPVSKNVEHAVAFVKMDDKRFFLERLIKQEEDAKILVFVRTKVRAERVAKAMERVDIRVATLHGDKSQKERNEALRNFKKGEGLLLIATDVSARGIDIPDVDLVVNYDLPDDKAENYVHRIGRTGRGKNKGRAISFCSPEEKEMLEKIEEFIFKPVEVLSISKKDYLETVVPIEEEKEDIAALMQEIAAYESGKKKKGKKKK